MNLLRSAAVLAVLATVPAVYAQGMLNYVDPSDNSTRRSRRETDKTPTATGAAAGAGARATPTPKPGSTPASAKGGMTSTKSTSAKSGGTTSSSSLAKPGSAAKPGGAKGAAGGGGFAQTGQLKEVTKQMVESIRTRKVDFDEQDAANDPAVILLNPRKLTPRDQQNVITDDLARPL